MFSRIERYGTSARLQRVRIPLFRALSLRLPDSIRAVDSATGTEQGESLETCARCGATDLTEIASPPHLHLGFDFKAAWTDGTFQQIIAARVATTNFFAPNCIGLALT